MPAAVMGAPCSKCFAGLRARRRQQAVTHDRRYVAGGVAMSPQGYGMAWWPSGIRHAASCSAHRPWASVTDDGLLAGAGLPYPKIRAFMALPRT